AEWVAAQRVEAGGDENEIGDETLRGLIDGALELIDIALRRQARRQGDIPDVAVPMVVGGAAAGIPGPLVHGDEVDASIALDQGLCPVAVVYVPVDDEHAVEIMAPPSVVGSAGDGVGVERAAAGGDQFLYFADVDRVVREGELLRGGVAALEVLDGAEEL